MPIEIGGVACSLVYEDGVTESYLAEGPSASVTLKCPWARRLDVLKALLGSVAIAGSTVTRLPPHAYPDNPNLKAVEIGEVRGLKPRRREDGWIAYDKALIPVTYRVPTWTFPDTDGGFRDASGQPYTSTKFRVSSEVLVPPKGAFYWPDGSTVEADGVGLVRSKVEISMTRHWMPYLPLNANLSLAGKLNSAAVRFADKSFARGTLLYMGMDSSFSRNTIGELTHEITYTMIGNESSEWNAFLHRDGTYKLINTKADGTGLPPFGYADFASIP